MKTVTIKIPKNFKIVCTIMNTDPAEVLQLFADVTSMNSFYTQKKIPPELKFLIRYTQRSKDPVINCINSQMLAELTRKLHFLNSLSKEQFEKELCKFHWEWHKKIRAKRPQPNPNGNLSRQRSD